MTRTARLKMIEAKLPADQRAHLDALKNAERKAYRALMNDPRVTADPRATHTPEIWAAYADAADAEARYREQIGAFIAA
jgi:hypothetical protein